MTTPPHYKPKGPWINRFAIRFFAVIWALLIFSSLGLLVEDVKSIPGPNYEVIERQYVDQALVQEREILSQRLSDLDRTLQDLEEEQRILNDGSQNLQETINQLLEIQRLSVEQGIPWSETEKETLAASQQQFLDNQNTYQALNKTIAERSNERRTVERLDQDLLDQIEQQRQPAQQAFNQLQRQHDLRLALLQLAIFIPLAVVGTYIFLKRLSSIYFPLAWAFGGATLLRILLVIWDYFPTRWLQYLLTIALLIVIARLLIYFIQTVASPKLQLMVKQFREAYEHFLCPVCEYPIRTGPRRHLYWTRATVGKIRVPQDGTTTLEEEYICPSCGTSLFEICSNCGHVRYTLLPHCHHCGVEKTI